MTVNGLKKGLTINSNKIDKTKCSHCPFYKTECRYRENVLEKNCLSYYKKQFHNKTEVTIFNNDKGGNWGFLQTLPSWSSFPEYTSAMLESPEIGNIIKLWIKKYPNVLKHVKSIDGVTELY